jgi:hypothetical protein
MTWIRKALCYVRLVDPHDGNLSITNAGMLITLGKIALATNFGFAELTAFFLALGAYQMKHWRAMKMQATAGEADERVGTLEKSLTGLRAELESLVGSVRLGQPSNSPPWGKR